MTVGKLTESERKLADIGYPRPEVVYKIIFRPIL